jgi:release factor glutamine methyltransferase
MGDGDAIDVRQVLAEAARALSASGLDDAGLDARRLLSSALRCTALDLIAAPERVVPSDVQHTFQNMLRRRSQGEPLARILGVRDFYGRPFRLTPATLEPRPDSECAIDTALALIEQWREKGRGLRILDIGTGSGCLLLTLLAELPDSTGVGTDISQAALHAAAENARHLGLSARASWLHGSYSAGAKGPFDLIISNPPYIPTGDIASLDAEVRDFDPIAALDGGPDGLDLFRAIVNDISTLNSNCCVVFETGFDQTEAVAGLITKKLLPRASGTISIHRDMAGRPRCVALSTQMDALDEKYLGI